MHVFYWESDREYEKEDLGELDEPPDFDFDAEVTR